MHGTYFEVAWFWMIFSEIECLHCFKQNKKQENHKKGFEKVTVKFLKLTRNRFRLQKIKSVKFSGTYFIEWSAGESIKITLLNFSANPLQIKHGKRGGKWLFCYFCYQEIFVFGAHFPINVLYFQIAWKMGQVRIFFNWK